MSEIKVGDLVMVVRPLACQCASPTIIMGKIFKVTRISKIAGLCGGCLRPMPKEDTATGLSDGLVPIYRLRRIDPLSELESTETKEETHA